MLHKRTFTVSIGDYGAIVALHHGKNIENKILVASINDENKPKLEDLFSKNKSVPVYIILDNSNQNYKKKTYPPVSITDFHKIVKRDLDKEFNHIEKSFRSYYGAKDKIQNKWDCTFVSVEHSPEIEQWLDFLLNMPNRLVGIYALPAESSIFAKTVFEAIKSEQDIKVNENTVISFILQNKISGIRQIVFFNQSIVFTRVTNYNLDDPNFSSQFEQDIFRANEYLKMIFPKLKAQDVILINLLSEEVLDKIKHVRNHEITFINYSPYQIAEKLGITNAVPKGNGNFSDILIANCFIGNIKKILKFSNQKISTLEKFDLSLKSILIFDAVMLIVVLAILVKIVFHQYDSGKKLSTITQKKTQLTQKFQNVNKSALEGSNVVTTDDSKTNDILTSEIIDFGKIDEILSVINFDIFAIFNKMSFIKKNNVLASSFKYNLLEYNPKAETFVKAKPLFGVSGELTDKSGDIEVLFKKFDSLKLETKKEFPNYKIQYSEISKDINFSKKYYSFPFDLTIETKENTATTNGNNESK
jgi:hypothetical protein